MNARLGAFAALLAMGIVWGFTIPMTRIAVSTGYQPLGLIFWQNIIMILFLAPLLHLRGLSLPGFRRFWRLYLAVALLGTVIPNSFSYRAAVDLPAGIMAIIIALVPMFAMPLSWMLGLERPSLMRIGGVAMGLVAVVLLVGPETSLPASVSWVIVLVALVAPLCYGLEGNYLAWRGVAGIDPMQVIWGASVVGAVLVLPLAVGSGQYINPLHVWGWPEWALCASSVLHGVAYSAYLWLVGRAGAVFAAQVAYVVTAAGVVWSMLLLGERYSVWVWAAFAIMMIGLALVQPRETAPETIET